MGDSRFRSLGWWKEFYAKFAWHGRVMHSVVRHLADTSGKCLSIEDV